MPTQRRPSKSDSSRVILPLGDPSRGGVFLRSATSSSSLRQFDYLGNDSPPATPPTSVSRLPRHSFQGSPSPTLGEKITQNAIRSRRASLTQSLKPKTLLKKDFVFEGLELEFFVDEERQDELNLSMRALSMHEKDGVWRRTESQYEGAFRVALESET
jgi:hypothetical protein